MLFDYDYDLFVAGFLRMGGLRLDFMYILLQDSSSKWSL